MDKRRSIGENDAKKKKKKKEQMTSAAIIWGVLVLRG